VEEKTTREKSKREVAKVLENQDQHGSSKIHQPLEISTQTKNGLMKVTPARKEKEAAESPRSPNTFPGDSFRATNNSSGHVQGQKLKTGKANLRTRVSLPQIWKHFSRKSPPMRLVQKGAEPVGH
jgi:hypothetical protein